MTDNRGVFLTLIDSWIPPAILRFGNEDQQARARIVLGMLSSCAVTVALAAFIMMCISLLGIRNLWIGVACAAAVSVGMMLVAVYFVRTASLNITANLFALIIFGSITGAVVFTSGWNSPVTFLLLSVPVIIFLVAGRTSGLVWSVITMFAYLIIYDLHRADYYFIQIMHEENRDVITTFLWCLACIIIISCLSLYDLILQGLTATVREERERFRREALYDPLTGAYNRDSFQKKIVESLEITRMSGGRFALLRFDIRNLKTINAQIDYASGDELVKKVADSVQAAINRDNDNKKYILARFGSGEFSVLMQDIKDRGEVISLASRIRKVLAEPVEISSDVKVQVQNSIGGVLAPDFSVDVRFLMRGAQDAMIECAEREEDFILR